MNKLTTVLVHVLMLALVSAVGGYWIIRIVTPQPTAAPPPLAAPPPREADPVLLARMMGLVQTVQTAVVSNVQVVGVFAAGADSSAVLVVDGKPPRAYLLEQEVAPGTRLVEVKPDSVVIQGFGGKQELRLPPRPVAQLGGAAPAPAYTREGNTLSAPTVGTPVRPPMPAQQLLPQPGPGAPAPPQAPQPQVPAPNPGTPTVTN